MKNDICCLSNNINNTEIESITDATDLTKLIEIRNICLCMNTRIFDNK